MEREDVKSGRSRQTEDERKGTGEMTAAYEMSVERMADLERRVQALEERTRKTLWNEEKARATKAEELVARHGEYVDKTLAARILGVTRATVYAMLADGRISGACGGKRVDVRSIGWYMASKNPDVRRAM